jgi:hypothetical protein
MNSSSASSLKNPTNEMAANGLSAWFSDWRAAVLLLVALWAVIYLVGLS